MNRFKKMTKPERKRYLTRKYKKFGFAPPVFKKAPTAKQARGVNRELLARYWDSPEWAEGPMTRRTAMSEAKSAARLKYQPLMRDLRDELRGSARQQQNIDQAFNLYKSQLADQSNRMRQAYQGATQQVFNQANTMATGDTASRQALDAQAQQSAAQRGAVAAGSGDAAAASRARQMLEASFGGIVSSRGLGAVENLLAKEGISDRERIAEHLREAGYAKDVREKRREAKADRGDFLRDFLNTQRENERRYGLEKSAFGLQKAEQKADIQHQKRADKLALIAELNDAKDERRDDIRDRLKDRWDMTDDQIDNALDHYKAHHPASDSGGGENAFTPTQLRTNKADLRTAISLLRSHKGKAQKNPQQAIDALISEEHYDPLLAHVAYDIAIRGGTGGNRARRFRKQYGFKPKTGGGGGGFEAPNTWGQG